MSYKTMCVVLCKKCEAENVLIVVQIWAEVLLFWCQVSLIVHNLKKLV